MNKSKLFCPYCYAPDFDPPGPCPHCDTYYNPNLKDNKFEIFEKVNYLPDFEEEELNTE